MATIPVEVHASLPLIQVAIGEGPPRPFLLDSGWSPSAIDADVAQELRLATPPPTLTAAPGGEVPASKADQVPLRISGIEFVARAADVVPLRPLSRLVGRRFDGILGNDFFARYVIEIDYRQRVVRVHEPSTYVYGGRGEQVRLEVTGGEPFVNAVLVSTSKRAPARLKLDTGSTGSLGLNGSYVQANALFPPGQRALAVVGAGVGGRTRHFVTRLESLELGRIVIPRPIAGYSEDLTRGGDAGTLGGELLRQFAVTFDQPHNRLILEPSGEAGRPTSWDMAGFAVSAVDDSLRELSIIAVTESTPAHDAGLQVGDVITAIDDEPVAKIRIPDLWERQRRPGPLRLSIRRDGRRRDILITARPLL